MLRVALILLAAVVAIILWNAGTATVGAVPLLLLCIAANVGKGHARKISELLQQYADRGDRSSPIFELPEQEAQSILNTVCALTGTSLHKTRRDYTIALTAQRGLYWYFGGSAKVLCSLKAKDSAKPPLQATLNIRYKSQMAVQPFRICEIK